MSYPRNKSTNDDSSGIIFGKIDDYERLLGLLGATKDGMVGTFEHRGVFVHREGGSIGVSPSGPPQDIRGGRHLLEGANIEELAEWVENKADYYDV